MIGRIVATLGREIMSPTPNPSGPNSFNIRLSTLSRVHAYIVGHSRTNAGASLTNLSKYDICKSMIKNRCITPHVTHIHPTNTSHCFWSYQQGNYWPRERTRRL